MADCNSSYFFYSAHYPLEVQTEIFYSCRLSLLYLQQQCADRLGLRCLLHCLVALWLLQLLRLSPLRRGWHASWSHWSPGMPPLCPEIGTEKCQECCARVEEESREVSGTSSVIEPLCFCSCSWYESPPSARKWTTACRRKRLKWPSSSAYGPPPPFYYKDSSIYCFLAVFTSVDLSVLCLFH